MNTMSVPEVSQEPLGQEVHRHRRQRLMESMGAGAVALFPGAKERLRNRDVMYPFRQDSDFLYLTGFQEPEALCVLAPGHEAGPYILFCRDRHAEQEQWEGRRVGCEGACQIFGADQSFPIEQAEERLAELLAQAERLFYDPGRDPWLDALLPKLLGSLRARNRLGVTGPQAIVLPAPLLHAMRCIKEPCEVALMRKAAAVTVHGHEAAMRHCRPGLHEYALAAELDHVFTAAGCAHAYPPIVGGGANALILHYRANDAVLRDGDLVLIDAGCEWQGYASDVTRTFPVGVAFSPQQRTLYELVLEAQRAAMDRARAGAPYSAMHDAAVTILVEGLVACGLLQGEVAELTEQGVYRSFYPHKTGHYLGLDVHDVGDYLVAGRSRSLEPGMAITVEPGLYIPPREGLPEAWWNIGIRIEDDILITQDAPEVLTEACPKEVSAIEALRRSALGVS